ncbi:hypothetical protein J5N97_020253 [Dioscorea zingiberensis]|uniref:AB hydrolase-1 domain-containing protein n=1 Tax=Dioscorea zingiberensis TaxID=325984 RepID=A0A9D5CG16_9LILI|nr:hypothetical protein J5N97_020253 [Dioscorea zingiberensis]
MEKVSGSYKHFVLVHGACHGAWCWFKIATLLEKAGHKVTAIDLIASGAHPFKLDDLHSFHQYVQPLMGVVSSLPNNEKVILVGHSLGGIGISLAMEAFPEKISSAVYLAAIATGLSFTTAEFFTELGFSANPGERLLDTQVLFDHGPEKPPASLLFGEKLISSRMYQLCQPEDIKLACTLMRPSKFFVSELHDNSLFTKESYGSVPRVYIKCMKDEIISEDFQQWMIERASVNEVMEIDTDHMAMLSKPHEFFSCLLKVAEKYHV